MKTKIFLGSLPPKFERKVLLDHFNQYGKIKSLKVLLKSKKQCSGCAILVCETEEARNKILSTAHTIFGKLIECHEYRRGTKLKSYNQDLWKKRVYIKNIPLDFSNIDLKLEFDKRIGKVKIASLARKKDKTGMAPPTKLELAKIQSGFVTFYDEADAKKAIRRKYLPIKGYQLELEVCQCYSHGNNKSAKKKKSEGKMEAKQTPNEYKPTTEQHQQKHSQKERRDHQQEAEYVPKRAENTHNILGEENQEIGQSGRNMPERAQPQQNNPTPNNIDNDESPIKLEVTKIEIISKINLNHCPTNIRLNKPGFAPMFGFGRKTMPCYVNRVVNPQNPNIKEFNQLYELFAQQYMTLLQMNSEANGMRSNGISYL